MKARGHLPTVFWVLAGVLLVGWAMLLAGSRDVRVFPSASSYGPSGSAALVELLRREGYEVRIDKANPPRLSPDDLAVCFFKPGWIDSEGGYLESHLGAGGRVLALPLEDNFESSSRSALGNVIRLRGHGRPPLQVTAASDLTHWLPSLFYEESTDSLTLYSDPREQPYENGAVTLARVSGGVVAVMANGLRATNRFLDVEQNAALLSSTVAVVVPKSRRVVFVEATFGNARSQTVLGLIGPWAAAAGWQLALLLVVIVFTLGRRFGLPELDRTPQRGARELVDAIGNVYGRARATPIALRAITEQASHLISRELKLPRDATPQERNRRVPDALALALLRAEAETIDRIPHKEALDLARTLDAEMEAAFGPRVATVRAPRSAPNEPDRL